MNVHALDYSADFVRISMGDYFAVTEKVAVGRFLLLLYIENGTISLGGHSYYVDMDYFLCDTFATITGIGKDAFKNVSNVKTMEMAKEISFIGDSAFEECRRLTEITIPEGVERFGGYVFSGTKWLSNQQAKNPLVIVNEPLIDGTTTLFSSTFG